MSDSIPRPGRSVAVIIGAVVLLVLALVYAAIAALFGALFWSSARLIVRVGDDMRFYPDFSLNGLLVFAPSACCRPMAGWVRSGDGRVGCQSRKRQVGQPSR
jgi:hypothetical protein